MVILQKKFHRLVSADYLFCKTDFKTENDFRIANDNLWDAKGENPTWQI